MFRLGTARRGKDNEEDSERSNTIRSAKTS